MPPHRASRTATRRLGTAANMTAKAKAVRMVGKGRASTGVSALLTDQRDQAVT